MKILFPEWNSFGTEDLIEAFEELGHTVRRIPFSNKSLHRDPEIEEAFAREIEDFSPDILFSLNYFPILTQVCKVAGIKYVSWIYDNPYVLLYTYTVADPCNAIFLFDKAQCMEFWNGGIHTVHYLPLAANSKRLSAMTDYAMFQRTKWKNQGDVAFIGSLYNEKHNFFDRLEGISDYTRGYLEGLMHAQHHVYGASFMQKLLTPDITQDMARILPMTPQEDSIATTEYLFSQYALCRELTSRERHEYLTRIASRFSLDLYTPDESVAFDGCINHGPVDYYDMAPYVFKQAKINLNITLRSIETGVPLRAFDILGAGGFLLTNYQADFDDVYVAGEDYVYYESAEDMLDKIDYYLNHESERVQIAHQGFQTTAQNHTYLQRVLEIMQVISTNGE